MATARGDKLGGDKMTDKNTIMTMHRLAQVVYCVAIGDALGVPYEFKNRGAFVCKDMVGYGTYNQPAGTWSDDTSMLLATCRSLKDKSGVIDTDDIMNNFKKWFYDSEFTPHGDTFDIGNATMQAIQTGKPQCGERSNGNGSLMRIAPLAFVDCTDDQVRAVSAITHGHQISMDACVIFVDILRRCIVDGENLSDVVHGLDLPAPFNRLAHIDQLAEDDIGSTGYVIHTLEAAIWCVLTSDTLPDCLLKAVNLGSDTDTTAAVAGALALAKFDFDQMPDAWVDVLCAKDVINSCL